MKLAELSPELRKRLTEAGHLRRGVLQMAGDRPAGAEAAPSLQKPSKYGARRVSFDGHIFESQLEKSYYLVLKPVYGTALVVHPSIVLYAGTRYKADFAFPEGGRWVFIDTKGGATKAGRFPTVCKLWRERGPGELRVIEEGRGGLFFVTRRIHPKEIQPFTPKAR